MNFNEQYVNAEVILIDDKIVTPISYQGKTTFIIPDEVVKFCINKFQLVKNNMRILDPMCGIGTIPRVINKAGGHCLGIEIDEIRHAIAAESAGDQMIILANYLEMEFSAPFFQCIFTSMPFDWFKEPLSTLDKIYAKKLSNALSSDGFILLDSVFTVNRDGQEWSVASHQCQYLEQNGFKLVELIKFNSMSNNESMLMKFTR